MAKTRAKSNDTGANLDFEAKLWAAADALPNNMDAAERDTPLLKGSAAERAKDTLGRVYEYFLARFAIGAGGIYAPIGHSDTFHNDRHSGLEADFMLAFGA